MYPPEGPIKSDCNCYSIRAAMQPQMVDMQMGNLMTSKTIEIQEQEKKTLTANCHLHNYQMQVYIASYTCNV